MGLFDFLRGPDIHQGLAKFDTLPDALLLDVRTREEFRSGHIPGAENVPLQALDNVSLAADNKDAPLFVYCQSGARSAQAAAMLRQMGYTNVHNIGGIASYRGRVVS